MRKLSLLALILLFSLGQVGCRSKRAVVAAPAHEVTDTVAEPPAPLELLAKILGNLRDVHTARYKFVKKNFYGVDDTVYIGNKNGEMIECECPTDTFGVSLHVINNLDGTFRNAYTMDYGYDRDAGDDFISKTDTRRNFLRFTDPPFFNRITRLCEYLLGPAENKTITVEDLGDEWQINATVREHMQVCFYGYPRVSTSDPYVESRFVVRVDKNTLMPVWTSYLERWPQQRVEVSVSDVELNPYPAETFRVEDFFQGLPVQDYDPDKKVADIRARRKHDTDSIKQLPLPTDPIRFATCDRTVSFPEMRGKVKVILLTLEGCGPCRASYPYLSEIYDGLPKDRVEMFAVMYDHDGAQPEAYRSYQQCHGITFPMVLDNKLYAHFDPDLVAPILLVIGGDDSYYLWELGFDTMHPEKYVTKVRTAITRALAALENQ